MKRFASVLTSLAVAGLVVAACDTPTVLDDSATLSPQFAAAATFTASVKIPINIDVFIPCADGGAGEVVFLSGNLHDMFHITVNDNRFTVSVVSNPQGVSGVGLTTGDEYHGTGVGRFTQTGSFVNGQLSFTSVNSFKIIGQGRGNNLLIQANFHITFNADGEVTVVVDNFSGECR